MHTYIYMKNSGPIVFLTLVVFISLAMSHSGAILEGLIPDIYAKFHRCKHECINTREKCLNSKEISIKDKIKCKFVYDKKCLPYCKSRYFHP